MVPDGMIWHGVGQQDECNAWYGWLAVLLDAYFQVEIFNPWTGTRDELLPPYYPKPYDPVFPSPPFLHLGPPIKDL